MIVNTVIVGADRIRTEWLLGAAQLQTMEYRIVRHYGQIYQTRVRAAASGRPGPRAVTGDYRRSITLEMASGPIEYGGGRGSVAIVGTNRPQARRLELGFTGVDSLGRHYAQPPYPHFEPPLWRVAEDLSRALLAAAVTAVA